MLWNGRAITKPDVEQHADAHEHEAGDQAVAEGEGVDRLQPVDLQDVHRGVRALDQRVDEQRARGAAFEEHHAGVDRRHAEPHRNHQQGFEHSLLAEVDEQEAEQHQSDPSPEDLGLGGDQGGDALEQIEQVHVFHAATPGVSPASATSDRRGPDRRP